MAFKKFVSKGVMNPNPFRGTPRKKAPPGDDPVACLRAMDAAVTSAPVKDELGPAILPCAKPWLELTLFDEDDRPVPGAPYSLSLPGGQTRSGTLDGSGFIHIDDLEADATQLDATVRVHMDDSGKIDRYEITVSAKVPAKEGEARPEEEEEPVVGETAEFLIV